MRSGIREFLLICMAILLCTIVNVNSAMAVNNGGNRKTFVTGQIMITVPKAMSPNDVTTLASTVNATVVQSFGAVDTAGNQIAYRLQLGSSATDTDTLNAVAALKASGKVIYAGPNNILYIYQTGTTTTTTPSVTPNDPGFTNQWDKLLMNCPEAWVMEKGESNVAVCVVDTGVDIANHSDEFPASRLLPGINTINTPTITNNPNPVTPSVDIHGTHVAGIALAQGNNGIGICGVDWNNVKLLPICAGTENGGFTDAALLSAFQYILQEKQANPTMQFVVNLSLGALVQNDTPDLANLSPHDQEILTLAKEGIIFCIAAGNNYAGTDGGVAEQNWASDPAYLCQVDPVHIMCVAACGKGKEHSSYSEARPYTTIAAPGGDEPTDNGIYSTIPMAATSSVNTPGYDYLEGTSMATPQVSGAAALLLSVPGVTPDQVVSDLTSTVQAGTTPDPTHAFYGAGIVDLNAALQKVVSNVIILSPQGAGGKASLQAGAVTPQPVESLNPYVDIRVYQVPLADLTITFDGTNYTPTQSEVQNAITSSSSSSPVQYDVVITNETLSPGKHVIAVSGVNPTISTTPVTDSVTFVIVPHQLATGLQFFSIPYYASNTTPSNYFGSSFSLSRWNNAAQSYEFYNSSGTQNSFASFNPPGAQPHPDGSTTSVAPIGLGYFGVFQTSISVLTKGQPLTNSPVVIPLQPSSTPGTGNGIAISWNMIGDPFPYTVPFNSVLVDTPGGRMTIGQAADAGYLLPDIYNYTSAGYQVETLPNGLLQPWQGYWIALTTSSNISLVVPPLTLTRSVTVPAVNTNTGKGWSVQLIASCGSLRDSQNYIGQNAQASDSLTRMDIPKPPLVSPYVSIGAVHTDWGNRSGVYSQDLQSMSGSKSWNIEVSTDQVNKSVIVSWDTSRLPRGVTLLIKDNVTGQVTNMRSTSSVSFQSAPGSQSRKYTITSDTSLNNEIRIMNLFANSVGGRGVGTTNIGFTISGNATCKVQIINATGQAISELASRAVSTGTVNMVWNGKDMNGRSVPMGTYLVEVTAVNSNGEVVRAIQPFTVLR